VILVTGATGFLGKTIVTELCRKGYRVRILARPGSDIAFFQGMAGVEISGGDILDPASLERAVQGCSSVVHAAALFRFWGDEEAFYELNVLGSRNVLQAALTQGAKKVILISTIAVAGEMKPGAIITEETAPNPVDPYQASKLQAEQVALHYYQTFGLEVNILRLGALYGPYGRYAFNRLFFEEFLRGWRIQVAGGRHVTFPCFVRDAAQGIEAAIRRGVGGEIYNIAGESISHQNLNRLVSRLAGKPAWRINMPKWAMISTAGFMEYLALLTKREPFYPLNLKSYVFQDWMVDTNKAQSCLGFCPTPIEEGVRETLDWYREIGIG
jgi:dihydroflavonol-4-reductase